MKSDGSLDSVQLNIGNPISSAQKAIDKKFSAFQQNGVTGLPSIPDLPSAPFVSMPSMSKSENLNLPIASIPQIKSPDIETPKADLAFRSMPDISPISKPEGIRNHSGKIAEVSDQVKNYQKEIKGLNPNKLDEMKNSDQWEDKLSELDEVAEIKGQIDLADQAKRYYDPEVAKEEALNKAKQEAINHFAGHEEELKAAMEQLSKLKAKMPDTEGVVDLFAKRKIFTKDSSFMKRFATGMSFQFQKQKSFWIDLNPHVVYKIFVAGIGWNERLAYDFDETQWDQQNHIYGPRSFVHFKFKTNFWFKGEIEIMNSPLRATPIAGSDIVGRGWVTSYFGGIKKDFQVSKKLKGHVQMLYNLYNPAKASPYMNRLNARMGIELPAKKRKTPTTTPNSD
jgi:hypothetical protein